MRLSLACLCALLFAACVAREDSTYPRAELARLNSTLDRISRDFPELRTPAEFAAARVKGRNGWPDIEDIGDRYSDMKGEAVWYPLGVHSPEYWRKDVDDLDAIMTAALRDTSPLVDEIDQALEAECQVPEWRDELQFMPGFHALDMLRTRAHIQIERGQLEQAREEARRLYRIAWRYDAGWSAIGMMHAPILRGMAVGVLLKLTERDPDSFPLLKEAIAAEQAEPESVRQICLFELAVLVRSLREELPSDGRGWKEWRREQQQTAEFWDKEAMPPAVMVGLYREWVEQAEKKLHEVREHEWDIRKAEDARRFIELSERLAAELTPFEVGLHSNDAFVPGNMRLIEDVLRLELVKLPLRLRVHELEHGALPPLEELASLYNLPEGIHLIEGENAILAVPRDTHPLRDHWYWDEENALAFYPRLKE